MGEFVGVGNEININTVVEGETVTNRETKATALSCAGCVLLV